MKRVLCALLVCASLLLCGCEDEQKETVFAMDTVMELQVWGDNREEAVEKLKLLIADIEDEWSVHEERSIVSKLNRGEDLSDPLFYRVQDFSVRTKDAFDPKLYSLSKLWGFATKEYYVPTDEEIAAAMADSQWDLGGVIKGYTGQKAVELLEELGVERALLNLGGNVQTYGSKPDDEPWSIGIQDPNGGDPVAVVQVNGTISVVTSGDYQRYFEEDGIRYHHIIDPATGKPANSGLRSVTVICTDGTTADALSTALFVMGMEEGSDLWRESDDFEAVFLTEDGKIYATEGVTITDCEYEVIHREN